MTQELPFSRDQLETIRRMIDKDPTLFQEVTGRSLPGRKKGVPNNPKTTLQLIPIAQAGQVIEEVVDKKAKQRNPRQMTDEQKAAFAQKMALARAAKKAAGDAPPPLVAPKMTKQEKLEAQLIEEAKKRNMVVKKTIHVKPAKKPKEEVVKKPTKARVLREESSDDDSDSELSVTSESEVSDGAKTLRKIKKTVAAIRQVDTVLSNGRNFVQMAPPKYNPWGR